MKPTLTHQDLNESGFDPDRDLGAPGEFPYTRGIHPTMYRGRLWTMRQYAGMGDAEASNLRYKFLLAHGTAGLSVAFDLPTQIGYDSDDPMSLGEVGKVGVAIDSLEDMERLFDGIPLDKISTSMTINATASILLAMYVAVAKRHNIPPAQLSGTTQNDVLKEYIARGTYIYPIPHAMRLVTDLIAWTSTHLPNWNPISISGYHMREAGATAAQELAFTLANAIAYVQAAIDSGLAIDDFAPRLSFFFNSHNNLLEEVAKFRAARRLWAHTMRERFGAKDPRSMMLRFHAQTAGSTLTAQQPENNIVRTTLQALAAVLGGAQSLHTNGYDEALALPTQEAARIALRTQQILAHESGVAQTIDPLAGSYYIESLTSDIQLQAENYLKKIDAMGGMLRAIEKGWIQQQIQNAAYQQQQQVDSGKAIIVGVNRFTEEDSSESPTPETPIQRINESAERQQVERVKTLRLRRDKHRWQSAIDTVTNTARSGTNLMPAILEAVESQATVGEISTALRHIFGEYQETVVV